MKSSLLTLSVTSLALLGAFDNLKGESKPADALSQRIQVDSSPPDREGPLGGFATIVERVAPSVVSISTSKSMQLPPQMQEFYDDPLLRRLFRLPDLNPDDPEALPKQQGLGSGVILTSDGYIVTNNHVVSGADEVLVTLPNNKKPHPAEVVGEDPQSDLAILKIDEEGLPTITAADSSVLKVGDTVLAIGNPFGLSQTVTTGIVSALGRTNVAILDYENFIQTDASINPGNSGGALVDNKGRLVGINTAILSRTGANIGIGFAIPINMVVNIADQLIATGEIQRGFLGVMLGELTPDLAEAFEVPLDRGVLVDQVLPNTPAEKAGFQDGDIILEVDGRPAVDINKTRLTVSSLRPGTNIPIVVLRDGEELSLNVEIGRLSSEDLASVQRDGEAPSPQRKPSGPTELVAGVTVENLNESYRQQLGLGNEFEGIVITTVKPYSEAASKDLRRGDVITEVGRQPVSTVEEALEARKAAKGDLVLLRVWRDGVGRFVALKAKT